MLENLKQLIPNKQNNDSAKDYFGFPIELGDTLLINSNSHFKIGCVLSITKKNIKISSCRKTSSWRKKPYVCDQYTDNVEQNIETLKDHNGTLNIYNHSGRLINLTKLNLVP